ncbi:MAG: hypothetical protein DRJ50_10780 [Actinobacteria bacterium]|nr:MAG: hypothetical protein DRJ50_10780 [Actinomycetota bacterium]
MIETDSGVEEDRPLSARSDDGHRRKRKLLLWLVNILTWMWVCANPAASLETISASSDVTIDLGTSVIVADEDVAVDDQMGIVVAADLGALPVETDVIALGHDANGDRLIAFGTTTALAGGVVARPGDVVRYDGSAYSIEFDARASGLPSGVVTDATSLAANGLLLSFDTTVDLGGGLIVANEDLVTWDGSGFSLLFDGSSEGVEPALNADAAQDLGGGILLMSFDTTGEVAGLVFNDEDVLRFDGTNWNLEFDGSAADSAWVAADLDAIMVPEAERWLMLGGGLILLASSGGRSSRTHLQPFNAAHNVR